MIFLISNINGEVKAILNSYAEATIAQTDEDKIIGRSELKSYNQACDIAAPASKVCGKHLIAIDNGSNHWPRFDIIEAPKVGDEVSYGFNGDYYPCGTITKISDSLRVIQTSDGSKFYRRHLTARWVMGGTWTMVRGHRDERNPSF